MYGYRRLLVLVDLEDRLVILVVLQVVLAAGRKGSTARRVVIRYAASIRFRGTHFYYSNNAAASLFDNIF